MTEYTKDCLPNFLSDMEFKGKSFEKGRISNEMACRLRFTDCEFIDCDIIDNEFTTGIFENVVFRQCRISRCSFRSRMVNCSFPGTILEENFFACDMRDMNFQNSKLVKNKFRRLISGYLLPPISFSPYTGLAQEVAQTILENPSKLDMRFWHNPSCKTAHCLAGWTIEKHPQGKKLEEMFGTAIAAEFLFPGSASYFYKPESEVIEFLRSMVDSPAIAQ